MEAAGGRRSGLALGILGLAILVAAIGDAVLRVTPWGLNFTVWAASLLSVVCVLAGRRRGVAGDARLLVAPALFFAVALAWRDSPTLKVTNVGALLLILAMAALALGDLRVRLAGLADYAISGLRLAFGSAVGPLLLLVNEIDWDRAAGRGWYRPLFAVLRGLLFALPALLLFGLLFAAADAVFERFARDLLRWDLGEIVNHGLVVSLLAWGVAGVLYALFFGRRMPADTAGARPFSAGFVELTILLGTLNGLFLAFVLIQARYLFGGADLVMTSVGLTYSEYARRGFFELVWVSALLLPLLLLVDWLAHRTSPTQARVLRGLMGGLVAMTIVVMASAVKRMLLYQDVFGLTELRVYPTAFMAWLAIVYGWFGLTVLRGRRTAFASGAAVAGLAVVAALNASNPDALIVRVNAGRADAATKFDAAYAASLSADAVPALVDALGGLAPAQRTVVAARLRAAWSPPADADWRTWSLARAQAWQVVAEHEHEIAAAAVPSQPDDRRETARAATQAR